MKYIILALLVVCWGSNLDAQNNAGQVIGKISYISSQNVYVKFESTNNIQIGDTLFLKNENARIPALVVNNLSSTSCVCTPISKSTITLSMPIYAIKKAISTGNEDKRQQTSATKETIKSDTVALINENKVVAPAFKQKTSGSISVASYTNLSNITDNNSTRFRYLFSLNARNIANSKFSFENYSAFQYANDKWDLVQANIFYALKIYNLSVKYDNNKNTTLVLGRKINPRISNMGAIDGIQYEGKLNNFFIGAIAGFRPNYADYSFDINLPQYGAYVGHSYTNSNGEMQSSFALVEQMNQSNTDRRFAYIQHTNSLAKNLYFFGSAEVELYQNINNNAENTFNLSSTYFILQYRPSKKLTFSTTYDNLKNAIYYETYKNFINQILEIEARKGLSLQANYYPIKNWSFGARTGYRFPNNNSKETKSLYGYVSANNITDLNLSALGAANHIETSYVKGNIYNLNVYRDFFKGFLYADLGYQFVDYKYIGTKTSTVQNILNLDISCNFLKSNSITVNYGETFEKKDRYSRLNIQLRKRF